MPAVPSDQHAHVAEELYEDYPTGFPYTGFELDQVQPPPTEDSYGYHSEEEEITEQDIEADSGFSNVVVVSGLPVVTAEKLDKLSMVVKKVVGSVGTLVEGGFFMPQDADGKTKGFVFVELKSPKDVAAVKAETVYAEDGTVSGGVNGYKLDKAHTFLVHLFDDIDKFSKVADEYQAPAVKDFKAPGHLYSWMADKLGRDQFAIRANEDTIVNWNDGKRSRSEEVYSRKNWTESFVAWSPLGTYITTLHRQGAAVWAGDSWERVNRYAHPSVRLMDYSPNEKYLITYSSTEPKGHNDSVQAIFAVHDVTTAKKLRTFEGPADQFAVGTASGPSGTVKWPVFKWAGGKEDKFFARLGKDKEGKGLISIFEAPAMTLHNMTSISMDGVQDFEWSPSEPILAAYTQEQNNMPATIALVQMPERKQIRQKNLFSVSGINICWHPQGHYLAVKVDRYTKTKKNTYTGFELFSIHDKDIPMEVLELPNKNDKIITFAWEPKGHRFVIVHGDGPRPSVSLYTMRDEKGRLAVKLLTTIPNKACTNVYWSPQGRHMVLAGLKTFNGQLEFFSADDMDTMATAEHFMATDVEWDPTGRYVATCVAGPQMENGYMMWSFQGKLLYTATKDRLFQFSWRPRLPTPLTPEREAELRTNLKQFTKRYDEEDEALLMQADADVLHDRKRLQDEWTQHMQHRSEYIALLNDFKREMYGNTFTEGEYSVELASVEQVVDTKEEPYKP